MAMARANLTLPEALLREVDEVAGPRGRSQYIAEAVQRQVRHDRQRKVFEDTYAASAALPDRMTDEEALAFAKELRAGS